MKPLLAALHKLWLLLIFVPCTLLSTALAVVASFLLRVLLGERQAGALVAPVWSRTLTLLLPLRVVVGGRDNIDRTRAYVVVSNHESQLDILALYGRLGLDLRWIVKKEIRNIPLLGWGCRIVGHVFVDRQNRDAAIASINQAVLRMEPGEGMLFFPEGTRSKEGALMPFKSGAFRTALMLNMPILPVSIEGAWELMRPGQLLPDFGTVRVKVHAAIETSGLDNTNEQVRELMQHARSRIAAGIDELQAQPTLPQPQSKLHEN